MLKKLNRKFRLILPNKISLGLGLISPGGAGRNRVLNQKDFLRLKVDVPSIDTQEEKVVKYPDRPEADRFFNYPFPAIEEALCNAVYHRSYEIREPVEVRILPDSITISSFPGPDRSIRDQDMRALRFLSRRYRNRRVGEFLKELEMTEGRGTGIPKMLPGLSFRLVGNLIMQWRLRGDRGYLLWMDQDVVWLY